MWMCLLKRWAKIQRTKAHAHLNVDGILKVVGQSYFSKGHNPSQLKGLFNRVGLSEDVGFRADPERSPSGFAVGVEKGILRSFRTK